MSVSYTVRMLCLVLLGWGVVQALSEGAFRLGAPRLLRLLDGHARRQEQVLFTGQLLTHVMAALFAALVILPGYLTSEANEQAERIGWVSLLAACVVGWRYLHSLLGGLRIYRQTAALRKASVEAHAGDWVLHVHRLDGCPPLAVAGLRKPRVFMAESLAHAGLSDEALHMAIDHERAHLRNKDHWKLFVLACLPEAGAFGGPGRTGLRRWQRYSDWAADDDAAHGSRSRALTLASSLLTCARLVPARASDLPLVSFATHEEELRVRVERLLSVEDGASQTKTAWWALLLGAGVVLAAAALLCASAPWASQLGEAMLHLG